MMDASFAERYISYPYQSRAFGIPHTRSFARPVCMSEPSERLTQAIKASGISMREMAERWGWSYNTLKSNANGSMPFSFNKAMVYGARLKVRAEWLYGGVLPMREPSKADRRARTEVPVIGWVQAGTLRDASAIQELDELERVTMDGLPPGEWFATDVRGDSMDRVSPEGSRVFVNAADRLLVAGGYFLFSLRGETTYKRYYDEPVRRLEPYSTNPANRSIFLGTEQGWDVIGRVYRSVIDLN